MLPWIKFQHNCFLQICVDRALSCMSFVRKKGHGCCIISSRIIIIREGQVVLPSSFDISWTANGSVPPKLLSSKIAMYFAQTMHPAIHYSCSQLHSQLASQLYCIYHQNYLPHNQGPAYYAFIMLCCSALKIRLLCSRTRIAVRLFSFCMQFCMAIYYMQQTIFIQTVLLVCVNKSTSILYHTMTVLLKYIDRSPQFSINA